VILVDGGLNSHKHPTENCDFIPLALVHETVLIEANRRQAQDCWKVK